MTDFFLVLVTHAALVSFIFLFTSLSATYFLFNATHGTPAEWRGLLAKVKVRISPDRVVVHSGHTCIAAPLNINDTSALEELLKQHFAVELVEKRLQIFKRTSLFVCFSLLFGVVVGTIIAAPILIGGKPYTEPMPWLSTALGIIGTGIFVVFGSLPHVHMWNALREAAASTNC